MESQPQNPEFRNNPENFHPCDYGLGLPDHLAPSFQLNKQQVSITCNVPALDPRVHPLRR